MAENGNQAFDFGATFLYYLEGFSILFGVAF